MLTVTRPHRRQILQTPEEVAASLRHLPGFVWLDTSGRCPEADRDGAMSLLAAAPVRIVRGLFPDIRPLLEALVSLDGSALVDWGLPVNGLIGSVDYDGSYCFGLYDEIAVYRHCSGEWFESGDLLEAVGTGGPVPVAPRVKFRPESSRESFCRAVERAQE